MAAIAAIIPSLNCSFILIKLLISAAFSSCKVRISHEDRPEAIGKLKHYLP